jgi:hypothetical protein
MALAEAFPDSRPLLWAIPSIPTIQTLSLLCGAPTAQAPTTSGQQV